MLLRNKNIRKIITQTLLVFAFIAVIEYVMILILHSKPFIQFKVQAILLVSMIAFLIHTGYKIWFIYDLDHPLSENGADEDVDNK